MMKRYASSLLVGILLLLSVCGNGVAQTSAEDRGSADHCSGNVVVCTVFVDNPQDDWDFTRAEDCTRKDRLCTYLGIACEYLQTQAEHYHQTLRFAFVFEAADGLSYTYATDLHYDAEGWDMALWRYIDANIPVNELLEKYDADSILFLTCMNTDKNCTFVTSTRTWYPEMPYAYEFVSLYFMDSGEVNPPAVYAHEILHCFGAPDLYAADAEYSIDDAFVTWVQANLPNDIMYFCSDVTSGEYVYDRITNDISEVTAYYIGWIEKSSIVKEHQLNESQYASAAK